VVGELVGSEDGCDVGEGVGSSVGVDVVGNKVGANVQMTTSEPSHAGVAPFAQIYSSQD